MSQINLIQCPSEIGAGTRGASLGPKALQINAAEQNLPLWADLDTTVVPTEDVQFYHAQQPSLSYSGEFVTLFHNIYNHFAPTVGQYEKNLLLTGDHSSAAAFFGTLKDQMPEHKWGLLWIDAHGDLHTPYTTPSGNYHGMPVANILGLTNQANAVRELSSEALENWEAMQRLGQRGLVPKLTPDAICMVDIRDLEPQEWKLVQHYGIEHTTPADRKGKGLNAIQNQIRQFADRFDALYVSFDVDSLDASLVPGTGTPVRDGLSWPEAEALLKTAWDLPQLKALEITEINPLRDHQNQVARHMNQVLANVMGC